MAKKVELHDSVIKRIAINENLLVIEFSSLVVLNVTDDFGFEFDQTSYFPGQILLANPVYKTLPQNGVIADGYVAFKDWQYELIPWDLNLQGRVLLFLLQGNQEFKIMGDSFRLSVGT